MQPAKIVLLAAEALQSKGIARRLKTDPGNVGRWRSHFATGVLKAIEKEAAGRGQVSSAKLVCNVMGKTTQEKPL
ncbi:MAG: hypothetical protein R3C18_08245 [Planctomycetaceae bacterium]